MNGSITTKGKNNTAIQNGELETSNIENVYEGSPGGSAVWRLPLAQGVILETRDRIPRWAPGAWSLLLPLPMSLPLSLSLSVTIINK